MTYPAFRGEGWSTRLNGQAAEQINNGGAHIGVLMCAPEAGVWSGVLGDPQVAGVDAVWRDACSDTSCHSS